MSGANFRKAITFAVVLLLMIPSALAASTKRCPLPGPVTAESYTWDFEGEVDEILAEFEREALSVRRSADLLRALARIPAAYSSSTHAAELTRARGHVNRMGDRLCRLLEIYRVAAPRQQETIDSLKVILTDLVNDTEGAIELLDERRLVELYSSPYDEYLSGMYRQADALCHCSEVEWARR